jgi:hypothetical protein
MPPLRTRALPTPSRRSTRLTGTIRSQHLGARMFTRQHAHVHMHTLAREHAES